MVCIVRYPAMGRQREMDDSLIEKVKEMLWKGFSQSEISIMVGVSQPTISNIKRGYRGAEVPWPTGDVGPMPVGKRQELKVREMREMQGVEYRQVLTEPVEVANRYMAHTEEMRERILVAVNERRRAIGAVEIPPIAPEYEACIMGPMGDEESEKEARVQAQLAEDKRRATVMVEFDGIILDEMSKMRGEAIESVVMHRAPVGATEPEPKPTTVSLEEMEGEAMAWSRVIALAPTHPLVKQEADKGLERTHKLAVRLVCGALPPAMWNSAMFFGQVEDVRRKLEAATGDARISGTISEHSELKLS